MYPVQNWTDKFKTDFPASGRKGWGGTDVCLSWRLNATTVDFIFADTVLCPDGTSTRWPIPPVVIATNTAARQVDNGDPTFYWGAGDTALLIPSLNPSAEEAWPASVLLRNGVLCIYCAEVNLTPVPHVIGITRFKITNPSDVPTSWTIVEEAWTYGDAGSPLFSQFLEDEANGFLYIFGGEGAGPMLARCTLSEYDANNQSNWVFWNGSSFVSGVENAVELFADIGTPSFMYHAPSGKYIAVSIPDVPFTSAVVSRYADNPWGPWSSAAQMFIPRQKTLRPDMWAYSAQFHPHIDDVASFGDGVPLSIALHNLVDGNHLNTDHDIYTPNWYSIDVVQDILNAPTAGQMLARPLPTDALPEIEDGTATMDPS